MKLKRLYMPLPVPKVKIYQNNGAFLLYLIYAKSNDQILNFICTQNAIKFVFLFSKDLHGVDVRRPTLC